MKGGELFRLVGLWFDGCSVRVVIGVRSDLPLPVLWVLYEVLASNNVVRFSLCLVAVHALFTLPPPSNGRRIDESGGSWLMLSHFYARNPCSFFFI